MAHPQGDGLKANGRGGRPKALLKVAPSATPSWRVGARLLDHGRRENRLHLRRVFSINFGELLVHQFAV
jgi:hypothetical protein